MASEVGRRIRELRKLRGLSQEELAEQAGLTLEAISRAERGRSEITLSSLARVCAVMSIKLPEFFERAAPPRRTPTQTHSTSRLLDLVDGVPEEELRRVIAIVKLVLQPASRKARERNLRGEALP